RDGLQPPFHSATLGRSVFDPPTAATHAETRGFSTMTLRTDRPDNVRKLGEQLAATGKTLEKKDVQALLRSAKDLGSVTPAEKAELQKLFDSHGDRFAADAREELAKFLGVAMPVSDSQALDGAVAARERSRAARGAGAASADKLAAVAAKL